MCGTNFCFLYGGNLLQRSLQPSVNMSWHSNNSAWHTHLRVKNPAERLSPSTDQALSLVVEILMIEAVQRKQHFSYRWKLETCCQSAPKTRVFQDWWLLFVDIFPDLANLFWYQTKTTWEEFAWWKLHSMQKKRVHQVASHLPSCVLSGPAPSWSASSGSLPVPLWSSHTGHSYPLGKNTFAWSSNRVAQWQN